MTDSTDDARPLQGALLLVHAIEEARDILFSAPWLL